MNSEPAYKHVSPRQVQDALASDPDLLVVDVRTTAEFMTYHIPRALHHPLDSLPDAWRQFDAHARLVLICEHGIRSEIAARFLVAKGFVDVSTMDGGMAEYEGEVDYGE